MDLVAQRPWSCPMTLLDGCSQVSGQISVKRIEPFSFWPAYASAIPGFGGNDVGPDPFYCFHTPYNEFTPGHVDFHLQLTQVRASRGELVLRVHAFPTDQSADAMMVSGSRLRLDELDGSDVNLTVRFLSLPGVGYALFGRYSEPSDLVVDSIEISAEEYGDMPAHAEASQQRSEFAEKHFSPVNKLCADRMPSLAFPVCQPCTQGQIDSDLFGALWPSIPEIPGDPVRRWSMVMPLQMLKNAGMLNRGARGLLLDAPHAALCESLHGEGCVVQVNQRTTLQDNRHYDFVIAYGIAGDLQDNGTGSSAPEELIKHVLPGGLVITMVPFDGEKIAVRNRLQQIALRLIGQGHEMAQICFPIDVEIVPSGHAHAGVLAILAKR